MYRLDELQKKFQQAKEERKKIQKEEELLKNRINHLHNQERNIQSKVENTKKNMSQIKEKHAFIKEQEKIRNESTKKKERELSQKKIDVNKKKTKLKENINQVKTLKDIKAMNTNISIKEEQRQNKKIQILNKLEDILKNATLHQSVRSMEILIEGKGRREILERKIKYKDELIQKLNKEEITKKQLDNELNSMNREEESIVQNLNFNDQFCQEDK